MPNIVDIIKSKLFCLPERDIKIAEKYLEKKDFESLRDLVNSDVYLVTKHQNDEVPNPKYISSDIDTLNELDSIVQEYCILINPDDITPWDYDDYEETEEDQEW